MTPGYLDPPLDKVVTDEHYAQATQEIDGSRRLDDPINLAAWFPERPYFNAPSFGHKLEAYYTQRDKCWPKAERAMNEAARDEAQRDTVPLAIWNERGIEPRDYPLSFDLSQPVLHFDEMARSMSVQALRVEQPGEIAPAIAHMLAHPGPFLIDLVLEGDTHPELIGVRCGQ